MHIAPSVTMNGAIRSDVMSSPATRPTEEATRIPAAAAVTLPAPARSMEATTTVVSATEEPTERSIPPCTMTNVMPTEAMATITVWRAMVMKFADRANVSGASATNSTYVARSATSGPNHGRRRSALMGRPWSRRRRWPPGEATQGSTRSLGGLGRERRGTSQRSDRTRQRARRGRQTRISRPFRARRARR